MNFSIDRIFDEAFSILGRNSSDPEEAIMDFIFNEYLPLQEGELENSFIVEVRVKPFENPVYILACRDDDTYLLLVLTKRDAVESGNFVLQDEISRFGESVGPYN